jgi:hypothetical protein
MSRIGFLLFNSAISAAAYHLFHATISCTIEVYVIYWYCICNVYIAYRLCTIALSSDWAFGYAKTPFKYHWMTCENDHKWWSGMNLYWDRRGILNVLQPGETGKWQTAWGSPVIRPWFEPDTFQIQFCSVTYTILLGGVSSREMNNALTNLALYMNSVCLYWLKKYQLFGLEGPLVQTSQPRL